MQNGELCYITSDKLLILTPVSNGWAVIGNPEKYLSAATYKLLESTPESIQI